MARQKWQVHDVPATRNVGFWTYLPESERGFRARVSEDGTQTQEWVEREIYLESLPVKNAITALKENSADLDNATFENKIVNDYGDEVIRTTVSGWSSNISSERRQRLNAFIASAPAVAAAKHAEHEAQERAKLAELAARYPDAARQLAGK